MSTTAAIIALSLATQALLDLPSAAEAFSVAPSRPRLSALHAEGGDGSASVMDEAPSDAATPPSPGNPFLPLLSEGLRRASVAMDKSTSDAVFGATPSLQRMRKQVRQLTNVAPSSLGAHAGLGLFATKNIKAGTVVGLYPAHALGYELAVSTNGDGEGEADGDNLHDVSMFLAGSDEDERYFAEHPHGNSPYLHATDQPLFQRPSIFSPLFDEGKKEMSPPLYLDVNPNRNGELDGIWTSHYINDGASLLDMQKDGASIGEAMEKYYAESTRTKNCIHIPFGPSPILATVTTKKVKKGQELFTSYGVVYWLGAVDTPEEEGGDDAEASERIKEQIIQSARDLQAAMEGADTAYATEMADLEKAIEGL